MCRTVKKQTLLRMRPLLAGLIVVLLAGCGSGYDQEVPPPDSTVFVLDTVGQALLDSLQGQLVLLEYSLDSARTAVTGHVVNNSDQEYLSVQLAFDLMAADSSLLGSIRDTSGQLLAGEAWRFSLPVARRDSLAFVIPTELHGEPVAVVEGTP